MASKPIKQVRTYTKNKYNQFKDLPALPEVPSTYSYRYAPSRIKRTPWAGVDSILELIGNEFESLGEFLSFLFHNRNYTLTDPRTARHRSVVSSFLHGECKINVGMIIELIYRHRASQPRTTSHERDLAFSSSVLPSNINNA